MLSWRQPESAAVPLRVPSSGVSRIAPGGLDPKSKQKFRNHGLFRFLDDVYFAKRALSLRHRYRRP
eukprot:10834640-Lingulodinium_polyedra.AAC.1